MRLLLLLLVLAQNVPPSRIPSNLRTQPVKLCHSKIMRIMSSCHVLRSLRSKVRAPQPPISYWRLLCRACAPLRCCCPGQLRGSGCWGQGASPLLWSCFDSLKRWAHTLLAAVFVAFPFLSTERDARTQCKIEFTYQSQKPNFKVVLEFVEYVWQRGVEGVLGWVTGGRSLPYFQQKKQLKWAVEKNRYGHNFQNIAFKLNQRGLIVYEPTLIQFGADILKIVAVSVFGNG